MAWKPLPLQQFLYLSEQNFLANAEICYAQSWALIDFLRQGGALERSLFEGLWGRLAQECEPRAAVESTFADVPLETMDTVFAAYVRTLEKRE